MDERVGNVLGGTRAEADRMLASAFVPTTEFQTLITTTDFNFVVGRRGTGKSALFKKVGEHCRRAPHTVVVQATGVEYVMALFREIVATLPREYGTIRSVSRLVWHVHLLLLIVPALLKHYKLKSSEHASWLRDYMARHERVASVESAERCTAILRGALAATTAAAEVPSTVASTYQVDALERHVSDALDDIGARALVMLDQLDEGWVPDLIATSILGGLALAATTIADHQRPIHVVVFVRDNMFRALAYLDTDFSRNLSDSSLRLRWDDGALFTLVAERLRVHYNTPGVESDVKLWNRFAQRELANRDGFRTCLQHTLYRPRDVIGLLNAAYVTANRQKRAAIVLEDLEAGATRISEERLGDLLKEYDEVLPGLGLFARIFRGTPARMTYGDVLARIEAATKSEAYTSAAARDFAILDGASHIFDALYGVGFLGVRDPGASAYLFCHDGLPAVSASGAPEREVAIHPAYWRALEVTGVAEPDEAAIQISDEYGEVRSGEAVRDLRLKQLGQIMTELPAVPLGRPGQAKFEDWALRAFKVLFSGKLANLALKPNGGAVQRRDIVGTVNAERGFWRRVLDDYATRQVVVEVKNYVEPTEDDFRQLVTYLSSSYGRFGVLLTRGQSEGLTENQRAWVKEMFDQHQRLIFVLPVSVVIRCIKKLRSQHKDNYVEDALNERLDTFSRSYLSLRSARGRKRRP